jgi:hypothetical protein
MQESHQYKMAAYYAISDKFSTFLQVRSVVKLCHREGDE